ncbi:S8 family serine peptidase [Cesiribacter andamanensis]|uniref:Serine protease AprX n=1 Tax=Cesiribacter andamanensis AMV16 TaxID=1279009 RepID=M7N2I4_9BACT|nr:S8 family serine peptidase [Cesiribacter andamanensis]EMR02878.1 Serine protease AprX [Cesiribacter andamanensis AMV16]
MKKLLLLCCILIGPASWAQDVNRYMVFFTDKEGSIYSPAEPEKFLSERAIQRRKKFNIAITEQDLPVNEVYVEEVQAQGVAVFYRSRWMNAILVEDFPQKVEALSTLPFVSRIQYVAPGQRLNARMHTPAYQSRREDVSDLQNQLLQVPRMHELGYTGQGIWIAVLDNGFLGVNQLAQFSHLFTQERLIRSWDFVRYSPDVFRARDHGTKALSTIAARQEGVYSGTAPDASFILAITEDTGDATTPNSEYIIEEYNWLLASEWADSLGADIISSSLGYATFDDPSMDYTQADMDGQTAVATRAASWAAQRGILVVTSSGNSRQSAWPGVGSPADADQILAVGAIDEQGVLAPFSSGGPTADGRQKPEVVALGVNTVVIDANGNYQTNNGTSFAAPQVAGLAAGVWQAYPELSNLELRELLIRSGTRATSPDNEYGHGVPGFSRLQTAILGVDQSSSSSFSLYPNPVRQSHLVIDFTDAPPVGQQFSLQLVDATGRLLHSQRLQPSPSGRYELDVSSLQQGFYYLKVVLPQGQRVQKFIRQ